MREEVVNIFPFLVIRILILKQFEFWWPAEKAFLDFHPYKQNSEPIHRSMTAADIFERFFK
jgi:hypothetical protein